MDVQLERGDSKVEGAAKAALRVLIVEDEALVAMLLEDMLVDFGCTPVGQANTIEQAVALAGDPEVGLDFAILDVNLGGRPVFPVAQLLADRGVPFVFATGYGASGLPEGWSDRPTLQKPFSTADVEAQLAAVGRPGG